MTTCDARTRSEMAMAEREHTTGKASERPKRVKRYTFIGVKSYASTKGVKSAKAGKRYAVPSKAAKILHTVGKVKVRSGSVKVFVDPKMAAGIREKRTVTPSSKRVMGGALLEKESREFLEKDLHEAIASAFASSSQEIESSNLQKISALLGGDQILGSTIKSELDAHELLNRGLPRAALSSLFDKIHFITSEEASEALGTSLRTLQRHKNTPVVHLDVQQSGRAWKFAEILAKATRVLGSQDEAEQWLRRPAIGLDQRRPVELLTTPAGVKLVEDYLGRLEYDVYT
jgi:putative toxin-antitoxin system antitoxin component (TIGR02293 family)